MKKIPSTKTIEAKTEKAKLPRLSRKQLAEAVEVILEAKFGAAGVELLPKARALKSMAELRGFILCLFQAETLAPVAIHLALKEILASRGR